MTACEHLRYQALKIIIFVCLLFVVTGIRVYAQSCAITVKPTVSGCYAVGSASKATVSVEVAWQNPPSGNIVVEYAGQSRIITPGVIQVDYGFQVGVQSQTIVSPQVVAFEVDLASTASGQTVAASFTSVAGCSAVSGGISLPAACQPTVCVAGQLGGTVWNDFNADGIRGSGESTGIPDVTVKAYDCSGALVGTTSSDAFGKYIFTSIAPSAYPLRIEFTDLPSYIGHGTLAGADGRTTVQFVSAADCAVDLGVLNPASYCQTAPAVYVSCFVNGDPLLGGTAGSSDAVVSFPYSASGVPGLPSGYTPPNHLATASEVGSIWGNAYNKFTKKIFMSATLRRHAGLGPMGLGGIYELDVTNPAAPVVSQFVNVTGLGAIIDDPLNPVLSNAARGLDGSKTAPSHDPSTLSQIGRAGIGDLDISADGNTLWFVSLHDKKLYSVDITAYNADGVTKPTAANTQAFAIPDPGCTGGTYRPYGLAVKDGEVFVGVVCDAGVSQNKSDMRAYVYKWDGATWTTVFDFPLTYPKGFPDANGSIINRTGWYPWTDDWNTYTAALRTIATNVSSFVYPMPILSDIEFDIDGAMILAFADRVSFIGGNNNYSPDISNTTQLYNNTAGGDILRAFYANGTYILENAAKAGPAVGYGPTNNQGPGFGEFYNENLVYQYNGSSPLIDHAETVLGALALRPGSGEVLVTALDPLGFNTPADYSYNPFDIGGVIHANNTTGQKSSGYAVYQGRMDSGLFGKATGLGDIELACDLPDYIEIGNRVWVDSNKDGVQDPCEKALAGVNVALYQGSTLIAVTTTNAAGEYYLNNKPGSSTIAGTASTTLIQPNTAYSLVFGVNGQFSDNVLTAANGKYQLTTANSTITNASDLNDSDAAVATIAGITAPVISVTTEANGSVNHTFDAGFICLPTSVATVSVVKAVCAGSTVNSDAKVLLTGIQNGDKVFLVASGGSVPSYTATGSQPVSASAASFTGLANPASSTGQSYSVVVYNGPCCYTVLTATLPQQTCICSISATAQATCHNNGTLSDAADDYITFLLTPYSAVSGGRFTITATQGGNPVALRLSDGSSFTALSYAYPTPLRTPAGTGGQGNIILTITDVSNTTCTTQVTVADPGSCSTGACTGSTPQTVTYSYRTPFQLTELNNVPLTLPKFSDPTRTLTKVDLTYGISEGTNVLLENTASTTANYKLTIDATATLDFGAVSLLNSSLSYTTGTQSMPAGITVAAQGTYGGDLPYGSGGNVSTLEGMDIWLSQLAEDIYIDPRNDPRWVSNATGDPASDNDIIVVAPQTMTATGSTSYTSLADLSQFTGTGSLSLAANTLNSFATQGGGGNVVAQIRTKAYAYVTVTYTFTCNSTCALSTTVTPGACNSATNEYSVSGSISLTSATAGTATVTDGATSATVAVAAGATSVAYSLTGLPSGTGSHTVVVSLPGCGTASATYNAPASCSVSAACAVTLKPTVSGCYDVNGVSKATVSIEVGWANAPAGENLIVSTGGQSATITPGSFTVTYPQPTTLVIKGRQFIVTPQVVAFEIDLTGGASVSAVTAQFTGTATCAASANYTLPAACPPVACNTGQLGGTVFRDFNADGIKQPTETQGVVSISVTAYDCNGVKYGPVLTDQFGRYTFPNAAITYPVRVEFSDPAGIDIETIHGSGSKTSVQFVNQATCSVDLGIANATLYCQTTPQLFVPCYVYGDPLSVTPISASLLSSNADALVTFPYDESTTNASASVAHLEVASAIGTVWGLGYNRYTKDLFMGAVAHRHAGLGPLGLGGIYVTHTGASTVTTESFIDVTTIGIDVGTVLPNGAGGRGLDADKTKPSNDADIFPKIGKVGIGGLEISEDGKQIWFVNLHDKKLYSIDITAYNQNPANKPTASDVKHYTIPDPGCLSGESRPWALHVYGGKMYVGTICDAFTTKSKSNLRAYVYAFDMTTNTFNTTPVFDFPLTYPKGYGISPLNSAGQAGADSTGWYPWTDNFQDLVIQTSPAGNKSLVHPQPILADIDFDIDGSLVLAFADRTGLQGGWFNYSTDPNDPETKYKVNPAAGDVLRAYFSGGTYILENNGKVGPFTGQGVNNNQGPGFGEFYNDNYFDGSKYAHTELALGGLALRPGSGHVVGTTIDPVTAVANSGGVKYWNNTNGMAVAAANVYTSAGSATNNSTFGKASGLGEPELNCNLLEVIEIGNRLWIDTNKDGIQDACEKALAGVKVSLYEGTTLIAATTTDAAGEYYFNSDPASATATNVASTTAIKANTTYTVRFGTDGTTNQYNSGTGLLTVSGLGSFSVTTAFSTAPNANTLNDSNAQIDGNVLSASVTTGAGGSVNHTIDAGFICLTTTVASISTVKATCSGITANSDAKVLLTGIQNGDKVFLVASGGSVPSYTATGSQPVSASAASFTGLANPASSTGQSYSVVVYNGPCCYTVLTTVLPQQVCVCSLSATVTPTVCNSMTNQYSISGTISLTNTPGGTALITDGTRSATVAVGASETSVTWSLTGLESGTGSHTVVVTLAGCSSAVTTYSAPASCTIAPSLVLTSATICYGSSATLTASSCIGTVTWSNSTTGTTLVTPNLTQNTTYTATCTTAAGATTSVVGTVTVMPQPVLSLQASSTFVTVNTPVSLSAIGCVGTLTWSTGQTGSTISVTPANASNTYSATCTTGPGCLTTASVTVNTEPAASIGVISAMICYSSVATLTTTGCTNGTVTWSNGTTGTSLTTPVLTQNTGYTATCTTSAGSTTSSAGLVTVMPQPVLSLQASSTNVTVGTPVSISAVGCTGTVTWSTGDNGSTVSVTPVNTTQTYSATCLTGPGCLTTASITVNTQPAASLVVVSATVCYGSSATLTASGCNNGTVTWSNNTTGTSLITPNLTQTTNYTATCTTSAGSTTSVTGTATVMPQPVLSLQASSTNVTVGTPVSLSAIGCVGTVTWSTGQTGASISVTPANASNTYSATCLTGPGCLTTASITINTQPAASLVVVSATVCYGSSATLTASGCNNGTVTWSNNTTGTSLITPNLTQTTNYTATCTTSAGSSTTAVGTATVVLPASLTISRTSAASSTAITVSVRGCTSGNLVWSTGAADNGKTSIVVPAAVSSQYSVTCTTDFGCRSTAQVSVGSANTNDFIVADAMICQGQSVTLTAIGCAGTLSWLGNGVSGQTTASVVVTPAQTQGYTAICTNGTNSVEVAAQVTVMATPVVTLTAGNLTVVSGSVVSLTASGCENGQLQWSIAGASGTVVSATASEGANVYSVSCVVTPTCSDVKSVTVTGLATSPILNLDKTVSASRAQKVDVISYTVTVSNTGNAAGYSIVVNDVLSSGLTILPASVSTNAGTYSVFSNQWSIGQLNAGAVATLTYSVSISADGVLYNTATIPGDTAKVCTTVPIKVCKDSGYQIRLNALAGYSSYQWYFKPVSGVETKVYEGALSSYTATQAGEYRVVVNAQASCPDQSCCPIIIEEQEVTSFTVVPTAPTCVAAQANTDGQLRVTGLGTNPGAYQYAVSEGTSFTVTSPTLVAVPANGVVATGLAGNKSYTVRIYDALGCYRDQTVLLPDTCQCPPAVCVPITVKRVIR